MGIGQSKQYLTESDLSDDESIDSDSEHTEIGQPVDMETVDAIAPLYTENQQIDLSSVRRVESEQLLDEPDIVGLVFLLYDERHQALELLKSYLLSKMNPELLSKWADSQIEQGNANWHKLFVEALSIVQNYKVLRNLGFDKSTLQSTYLPSRSETTCGINQLRKTLYLNAEKLTGTQTSVVVSFMREVLLAKGISVALSNTPYLELYFMLWECNQIDFKHLQRELKRLELDISASEIEAALPTQSNNVWINPPVVSLRPQVHNRDRKTSTVRDNIYLQPGAFEEYLYGSNLTTNANPSSRDSNVSNDSDRYDIDPNHPGVVLIINQESFYTETAPQYRHLLHENNSNMLLEERKGTVKDKERLKRCFSNMNFKVFVQDNVPHYQILKSIEDVTDSVSVESSLIVCILSHGEKGVVYGANSCKLEVSKIENVMCRRNQNLHGKPKVLILQSCQGKYCQKIEEEIQTDDGNTTDGPSRGPATTDLLTFWATIPGFAAVRNLKTGSWFIQSLCDEIEQSRNQFHFLDICTKALRKVSRQVWKEPSGTNVMVPMGVFTLTKSFYLPPFKNP